MAIDYKEIGKRIARKRHELGLKQTEVCEQCFINEKYLSNIERAKSIPSIDVLLRICQALDTTPDAILLGTNKIQEQSLKEEILNQIKGLNLQQLSLLDNFLQWLVNQKL